MILAALALIAAIGMESPPALLVDMPPDGCWMPDSCANRAVIQVAVDGKLSILGESIRDDQLVDRVRRYYRPGERVLIEAAADASYERVQKVLGMLKAGGFLVIGLIRREGE